MTESVDDRLVIERRHCADHTGIEEKTKSLQGQISSRLNLMIGLLTLIIALTLSGMGYIIGALSSHDRTISRLEDRQNGVLEDLKIVKSHYDSLDKRIDDLAVRPFDSSKDKR